MSRSVVVLPLPLGPRSVNMAPSWISSDTFLTAWAPPSNPLDTFWRRTITRSSADEPSFPGPRAPPVSGPPSVRSLDAMMLVASDPPILENATETHPEAQQAGDDRDTDAQDDQHDADDRAALGIPGEDEFELP